MDRGLRERIREEAENHCELCGAWCGDTGSPHHIIKVSEEKLLENCKRNIVWVCMKCHRDTENIPGFNKRIQRRIQERYFKLFMVNRNYTSEEIAQVVQMPVKDIDKAIRKGFLKWQFIDGVPKATGLETIRFLLGGKLK